MKAKRFTCGEVENYPTDPDWIMATDADRLEAAIARKDEALKRCVEAIASLVLWLHDDDIPVELVQATDAARAALEET